MPRSIIHHVPHYWSIPLVHSAILVMPLVMVIYENATGLLDLLLFLPYTSVTVSQSPVEEKVVQASMQSD